jgi:relaxase-like protein/DNA relaxase TraI-like protein
MIATSSSGRRFAALARYLLHGRSGEETERVAWTAGRNLGTDDPEVAAALMQATSNANLQVESPVYHLTINFDPADAVTPEQIEAVADRVLKDLGLAGHQALMVAHRDRTHPHVHIMVNRVHPETLLAWDRWQDQPKIQRTLRMLERELGLREVAGRLYQLDGQEPPERAPLTNGEHRQAKRSSDPAFPDRVRAHLPELRATRSWEELEAVLASHGLCLERKGQGLVITDGTHQVKASRVARDLSLRQLEAGFGVPYPRREPSQRAQERERERLSPAVKQVVIAIEEHERVAGLNAEGARANQELATARRQLERMDRALERIKHASERFESALTQVYREPARARELFTRTTAQLGYNRSATLLEAEPERFGALKTVEQRRALGLRVVYDDRQARAAAPRAAFLARELVEAEQALATLGAKRVEHAGRQPDVNEIKEGGWLQTVRAEAAAALARSVERLGRMQQELKHAPSLDLLERSVGRAVDRLMPREIAQLRRVLTAPRAAIAFKAKKVVKDLVLGREDDEE